jgi:predicted DNA-binding transcriptional regulator AlpA
VNTQLKWPATRPPKKSQAGKNWYALKPRDAEALKNFDSLPDSAGVRVGVVATLFGVSSCTVWRDHGERFPKKIKIGPKTTVCNVGETREKLREATAARGAA